MITLCHPIFDITITHCIVLILRNSHRTMKQIDQKAQVDEPQNEALERDDHHGNGSNATKDQLVCIWIDVAAIQAVCILPGGLVVKATEVDAKDDTTNKIHDTDAGHKEGPGIDGSSGRLHTILAYACEEEGRRYNH